MSMFLTLVALSIYYLIIFKDRKYFAFVIYGGLLLIGFNIVF